jgi:Zn-dependent membrane protease YugP
MSSMQLFLFLIIPTVILGMYAQAKVQGSYKKWSRVG